MSSVHFVLGITLTLLTVIVIKEIINFVLRAEKKSENREAWLKKKLSKNYIEFLECEYGGNSWPQLKQ